MLVVNECVYLILKSYYLQNGEIAHQLEYVNHNVRTRLDELKRTELERLRNLIEEQVNTQIFIRFSVDFNLCFFKLYS